MTSFRIRFLAFILLVFTEVPALAQEGAAATVSPAASLGCLGVGLAALIAVGLLAQARESQERQDLAVQPNPDTPAVGSTVAS